ncbi:hypothetical protein [Pseudomonas sp. B21-053]|uniref:hypothetical protein n=1 Tax=Pseudomonas sp. B21-053 TaxID=2895493 RepID=UPI00222E8733|nr:hypothetical protein [Pseudomonas sp. B21-053]UZE09625.1 hypothetical protein LOY68_19125 [Pseudomonas sp. B21-053]
MSDDSYARYIRFQTPDPGIAPREQAPMLAQEQAWARVYASGHRFSWITVLVPPLCFGPVLPGLAFLLGLLLYQSLFAPRLDIDQIIGASFGWLALATLLFMAAWVLRNYLRDTRDPTKRYWQSMPDEGLVELERHSLESGINLWSSDYDPDCNTLMLWKNGKLEPVQDSGVSQWVVAKTAAGHWLVLKEQFPGNFSYGREGEMPAPDKHLQPAQELAIAFAPGTNLVLGRRFSGAPLPLVNTPYWLSADELKRLVEIAHHWTFFPPDRYAVVNQQDAGWLQRLVDKAHASVGPLPERQTSTLV